MQVWLTPAWACAHQTQAALVFSGVCLALAAVPWSEGVACRPRLRASISFCPASFARAHPCSWGPWTASSLIRMENTTKTCTTSTCACPSETALPPLQEPCCIARAHAHAARCPPRPASACPAVQHARCSGVRLLAPPGSCLRAGCACLVLRPRLCQSELPGRACPAFRPCRLLRPGGVYSFFNGLAPDNMFFHLVYGEIARRELGRWGPARIVRSAYWGRAPLSRWVEACRCLPALRSACAVWLPRPLLPRLPCRLGLETSYEPVPMDTSGAAAGRAFCLRGVERPLSICFRALHWSSQGRQHKQPAFWSQLIVSGSSRVRQIGHANGPLLFLPSLCCCSEGGVGGRGQPLLAPARLLCAHMHHDGCSK